MSPSSPARRASTTGLLRPPPIVTAARTAPSCSGGAGSPWPSRVRAVEGSECHLESYDVFGRLDLLTEHTVAAMLAGLSTRDYSRAGLEPVGSEVQAAASSTSSSAVSRRFVSATATRLLQFRSRDLSSYRFVVVFGDGFDFAGHTMVGALGVTADGLKIPLGVVEGSTRTRPWSATS